MRRPASPSLHRRAWGPRPGGAEVAGTTCEFASRFSSSIRGPGKKRSDLGLQNVRYDLIKNFSQSWTGQSSYNFSFGTAPGCSLSGTRWRIEGTQVDSQLLSKTSNAMYIQRID